MLDTEMQGPIIPDTPDVLRLAKQRDSLGELAITIANRSGKLRKTEGAENIAHDGRFIFVLNHFVSDKNLPLDEQWEQALSLMGVTTDVLGGTINPDNQVMWLAAVKPKSAIFDEGGSKRDREIVLSSDQLREELLAKADDVIPIDYTLEGGQRVAELVKENLSAGNIVGLFAEEGTGSAMQKANSGFARMAIENDVPVYPVAVFTDQNEMRVSFGKPHQPPEDMRGKSDFADGVMRSIAEMLPEENRGYYQ